jgi:hypothetical protein
VGIGEEESAPVALPVLYASPNPAQAGSSIHYSVTGTAPVDILVYDVQGRLVSTLSEGVQAPGSYETWWDATEAAPGVYFLRLISGDTIQTGRLVINR